MTTENLAVVGQILTAIENDSLVLPTLPDVAIKLQQLIDNPHVPSDQIVLTLTSDPFISAQLIRSANSAIFADKRLIDTVRGAIARLGYRQVRNLVMAITMNKMFQAKHPVINKQMKAVWEHSRTVAAVSYVLAARQPHLSPDQAMLAGLVHKIGALPLCLHMEKNSAQLTEESLLELLQKYGATVGTKLLKKWNFPGELLAVPGEHENLQRDSSSAPRADYTDVIMVANLLSSAREETEWDQVAAVQRLGMTSGECQTFVELNAERIADVAEMLGIKPPSKEAAENTAAPISVFEVKNPLLPDEQDYRTEGILISLLSWVSSFWRRA